ncbi:MAG: LysE family transporter [Alphaproteobacteria bacterium]|nr:LysE family transporter [Alphaproteobacteria bacterium]
MANDLLLLWLTAFPLMGSPGPATLGLAGVGTAYGFHRGVPFLTGIILGTVGVLVLVASGATAIILSQPVLTRVLTLLAMGYILYLAWRIASAPIAGCGGPVAKVPTLFTGLVLALANPKAFAVIGAVYVGQRLVDNDIVADTLAKLAALSAVIVITAIAWLAFGSLFSQFLTHPRLGRVVNIVFAVMLVVSVGFSILSL